MSELDLEHGPLLQGSEALCLQLKAIEGRYQHGDVQHYQHTRFAERAHGLGRLLSSVARLIEEADYPSAFSLLRTALEHHLFDQLLFRATKYEYVIEHVSHDAWATLEPTLQGPDLVSANLISGRVVVVKSGVHFKGGEVGPDAPSLSVYYHYLQHYQPFLGHPKQQALFATEHLTREQQEDRARAQQAMYGTALKWPALQSNLELNQLYTERDLFRLDVHFRFLSAFVHPSTDQDQHLYGRNVRKEDLPRYDHYSSELGLLYILWIGTSELRAIEAMSTLPPSVTLIGWSEVEDLLEVSDALTAHTWFPGQEPLLYDRVQEANGRVWSDATSSIPDHPTTPDQLTADEIGYYRDPLSRLVALHRQVHELMGFNYISPWPRSDAQAR